MKNNITKVGFVWEQIFDIFDLLHDESKLVIELLHAFFVCSYIVINHLELQVKFFTHLLYHCLAYSTRKIRHRDLQLLESDI